MSAWTRCKAKRHRTRDSPSHIFSNDAHHQRRSNLETHSPRARSASPIQPLSPSPSAQELSNPNCPQMDGNANIADLEAIMGTLKRLRTRIQNARLDEPNHDSPTPQKELNMLRGSLHDVKRCMAAFKDIESLWRKRARVLRKTCVPLALENGVKSIPDEIISQIFEAGHRMTEGWAFGNCMSKVSRRFRNVSLQTHLLWTRISAKYTEGQLEAFLSRSGTKDLHMVLKEADLLKHIWLEKDGQTTLPALRLSTHRWSRLRINTEKTEIRMRELGFLDLPRLQFLDHHCDVHLSSWNLPLLSHIHGCGHHVTPLFAFRAQLTTFEVLLWRQYVDAAALAQAIFSMENLKHLSVTIKDCMENTSDPGDVPPVLKNRRRHSVPIDTVEITVIGYTTYWAIGPLYDALSVLSASTFSLTFQDLLDSDAMRPGNFYFTPKREMFPYGSVINIKVLGIDNQAEEWSAFHLLTKLVKHCSIAHTISIEARKTPILSQRNSSRKWGFFAALRHLRFTRCDELTEWELKALVRNLLIGAEPGMGLQSLDVIDCRGISEECLLELSDEVGPKLSWKR